MAARPIYNPDGFCNVEKDGKVIGYQFQFKAQYYRGVTLSIVRDLKVNVDGVDEPRENLRFTVNGETFTLDQMSTVIDPDYRWEFGEYATVTVLRDGGLAKGKHHINALQHIEPSYMPFPIDAVCETDFEI
ncbi:MULTISPECIES: C-glycoside deglycosidase beta subunit domain-containing protein [Agathobacter]|uniref:C-deglycosylation enzyme beta subunit n=1 Tax=Agathobacter ruminis TaxID=1712665 RepID=A0A2G3E6T0_9FIRM|nr:MULTISPECIES: DUF6379 domain-containing protein [Agathobacter]MBQ1682078.1 hypothetical protein [Agathobacter sp.]MCR5676838.1 DUF6379 domain-containing protein [Agathobacter sp.]MDC7301718.1 DUF6379 domain-containing protein [Agathobacter ruminis]PHU38845.1 hypothetical protein CSX02_00635 [Agathobacter ruminis]